ncbi:hypothetical protein JCM3770_001557 [Rhodotorula araucariae]
MQPELALRPVRAAHIHPQPNLARVSPVLRAHYAPASDGADCNLVILLHGLGDTAAPFFALGKSLNLPQTAVLSLQAPDRVPLLEEEAWQWWDSFDSLGELIPNPNPAATLHLLDALLTHLTSPVAASDSASAASSAASKPPTAGGCGWHPSQIHLFGYAQGGTCAGELALAWARAHPVPPVAPSSASLPSRTPASPLPAPSNPATEHLASVVAVSAPLLSHPTPSAATKARTKALLAFRQGEERAVGAASWRRGFEGVEEARLARGDGMLRGMDEWRTVMRFWSTVLVRKSQLELSGEVYELAQ